MHWGKNIGKNSKTAREKWCFLQEIVIADSSLKQWKVEALEYHFKNSGNKTKQQ